jgi:hypothetical protein
MKKVSLKKKDANDMQMIMSFVVSNFATSFDFKDLILLQKAAMDVEKQIQKFSDKFQALAKEKDKLQAVGQKRISDLKHKMFERMVDSDVPNWKEEINKLSNEVMEDIQKQLDDDLNQKTRNLYKKEGEETVEIELSNDKLEILKTAFEKHGKDVYTNMRRMVETYEALTTAK